MEECLRCRACAVARQAGGLYHPSVGEDSEPRFLVRTEGSAIDQFTLKDGEEALAQRVVIAVASSPH